MKKLNYMRGKKGKKKKETKLNLCSAPLSCPSVLRPASRGGAVIPEYQFFTGFTATRLFHCCFLDVSLFSQLTLHVLYFEL